jgi:hypothetical protein
MAAVTASASGSGARASWRSARGSRSTRFDDSLSSARASRVDPQCATWKIHPVCAGSGARPRSIAKGTFIVPPAREIRPSRKIDR